MKETSSNKDMGTVHQSITASEGSNVKNVAQITGDVTGFLHIGDIIVPAVKRLSVDYAGRIQNFFEEYLGSVEHPIPFGGRHVELATLDEWLTDLNTPPYAIITAEAGRGKSALLVRWAQTVIAREFAHVVFIPISIRFNTALSSVTFMALAAQLGEIYGEPAKVDDLSAEQWKEVCLTYLRRTPPSEKPVLVILDGLDEATDWQPRPDMLPLSPPEGVKVIVSARRLPNDLDEQDWLRHLGWKQGINASTISLAALKQQDVFDVLKQTIGVQFDYLTKQIDMASEIFRLSKGEPLLVGLYIEALLPYGKEAGLLNPEDLPSIGEGLDGYFKQWWTYQWELWELQGRNPLSEGENVLEFLNICATALGPLSRDDIVVVAGGSLSSGLRIKQAAKVASRFIIGDGDKQGYVFSHFGLAQFFWKQMSVIEQKNQDQLFLDYGRDILSRLNKGHLRPAEVSLYILQFYGSHLERAGITDKQVYDLVSEGWMRAWEKLEKSYSGFLNNSRHVWKIAIENEDFEYQMKCALCQSSVTSLSYNVTPSLLVYLAEKEILSELQLASIIRQTLDYTFDVAEEIDTIIKLAPHLPNEMRNVVHEIQDKITQIYTMCFLLPWLPDLEQYIDLDLFFSSSRITSSPDVVKILIMMSRQLPEAKQIIATEKALEIARSIELERERFSSLIYIAPLLSKSIQAEIVEEVWEIARQTRDLGVRVSTLVAVTPLLSTSQQHSIVDEALDIAFTINADESIMGFFGSTEPVKLSREATWKILTPYLFEQHWQRALEVLSAIEFGKLMIEFAEYLPESLYHSMLETAHSIPDDHYKAQAIAALVPQMSPTKHKDEIVDTALRAAYDTSNVETILSVCKIIAPYLSTSQINDTLSDEILEAAGSNIDLITLTPYLSPPQQIKVLNYFLTSVLDDDMWDEFSEPYDMSSYELNLADRLTRVLEIANTLSTEINTDGSINSPIPNESILEVLRKLSWFSKDEAKLRTLQALLPLLPEDTLPDYLGIICSFRNQKDLAIGLNILAPYLSNELLGEALLIANSIQDERLKREIVRNLIVNAPKSHLSQTLEEIRSISEGNLRSHALSALIPFLPETHQPELVLEALHAAQSIQDDQTQARFMVAFIPYLPKTFLPQVLIFVRSLDLANDRVNAFLLILHLLDLQQEAIINEILEDISELSNKQMEIYALSKLAPYTIEPIRSTILTKAIKLVSHVDQIEILTQIRSLIYQENEPSTDIPFEQLSNSLTWSKSRALDILAPMLTKPLLSEALKLAQDIKANTERVQALLALIPHLTKHKQISVYSQATEATLSIPDPSERMQALLALVSYAPPQQRTTILEGILAKMLESTKKQIPRRKILDALIDTALSIPKDFERSQALTNLIPHLSSDEQNTIRDKVINTALSIPDNFERSQVLINLIPHISSHQQLSFLDEVITRVHSIGGELNKVIALTSLIPYLLQSTTERENIFDSIQHIGYEEIIRQTDIFPNIIILLTKTRQLELLQEIIGIACVTTNLKLLKIALRDFLPTIKKWDEQEKKGLQEVLEEALIVLSTNKRPFLLERLAILLPLYFEIVTEREKEQFALNIYHILNEICEWFP